SPSSFSSSNELLRRLLRVDPFFRTRQLNRHIRNPKVEGLPIHSPAMIRGEEEWTSLFVVYIRCHYELGRLGTAAVVDDLLDSLVSPNVKVPGVAGLVAALRRRFDHDPFSGSVTQL